MPSDTLFAPEPVAGVCKPATLAANSESGSRARSPSRTTRARRYASGGRTSTRLVSAGFENDIVLDLREYATSLDLADFYRAIGGEEVVPGPQTISGHTVIDGIQAIRRLSSEEFYRLFGQSTSRALVFTNVTSGEGPLVAMRVVTPTPNAVVLHGLSPDDLWEYAPAIARLDGFSLGIVETPLPEMLEQMAELS